MEAYTSILVHVNVYSARYDWFMACMVAAMSRLYRLRIIGAMMQLPSHSANKQINQGRGGEGRGAWGTQPRK